MTRVIIHGCNGAMGQVIAKLAQADDDVTVAAGLDIEDRGLCTFPVYTAPEKCAEEADCVIDFSTAKAVDPLLDWCAERKLPLVLCTTGLSEEQLQHMREAAKETAILRSANMSLGVNLLLALVKEAAKTLAPNGFDVEIVEKHHRRKIDAPSGTALALADSVNEALDGAYHYRLDRSGVREKRDPKEIGIQAVRGGTIVGEHDVIFAGEDEVITLNHTAYSRAIFGKGAVTAAKFLSGKGPGLYSMEDVIGI
ncbi:MAG: 4-hydroxy-tetrahydrodipicolinate reductase [Clostridium sp.]|nr:4-hydroxy-tetrahydrodipicolinate reductase [Clostridium sp.]